MFFKRSPKKDIKKDDELLSLYQATGDIAYLGELYERHLHLVFGVCMKYLKHTEESKDMSMQVFEKLSVAARSSEIRNFTSWLHVLTKNECLMLLRSRAYQAKKNSVEIREQPGMDMAYSLHHTEEETLENSLQELEGAIDGLPQEQKQCVSLFYLEQKCYKDIAAITGYELKQVKSYIQNGKRNLRLQMNKLDEKP